MAATINDGLNNMARSDLSGLKQRIDALRKEAEKQLQIDAEHGAIYESFIAALKLSKLSST